MYSLCDYRAVSDLLHRHGFKLSKDMGQNFLIDGAVPVRIADEAEIEGAGVLEIGPGIGALTCELCRRAKKVLSVELDPRLIPILKETMTGFDNLKIINADIMKLDLKRLIEEEFDGTDVRVCANLPYYITTPIVMSLLEGRLPLRSITVMVQKEVAVRLCAPPGSKDAGAVSLSVSYWAEPQILFEVPPESFMPRPKVHSAVIRLDIRDKPLVEVKDERLLFTVIKAAFSMRRKTLVNALSPLGLTNSREELAEIITGLGLDPNVRGERLSLEDFAHFCEKLIVNGINRPANL